jgi:hypothetical protein
MPQVAGTNATRRHGREQFGKPAACDPSARAPKPPRRAPSPHGGMDVRNLARPVERGKQRSGHRPGGSSVQRARLLCDCRVIVTNFSGARCAVGKYNPASTNAAI